MGLEGKLHAFILGHGVPGPEPFREIQAEIFCRQPPSITSLPPLPVRAAMVVVTDPHGSLVEPTADGLEVLIEAAQVPRDPVVLTPNGMG